MEKIEIEKPKKSQRFLVVAANELGVASAGLSRTASS